MIEKLFKTRLENKREIPVIVEEYGRILLKIGPGEVRNIESRSPMTSYAPWSEIVFSGTDKISFTENKEWEFPWPEMLMLTVLNVDGQACEGLYFGGKLYDCYRGIPRFVPISYADKNFYFVERLEKRLVERKVKDGDFLVKKMVLENIKTLRSKREIKEIEKKVLAEAAERAEKETKRRFLKPEAGE
jgi:hypothetical protein